MSRGQHISKIILDAGNYITIPRPTPRSLARFLGMFRGLQMVREQHISKIILDAGNSITTPRLLARFLGKVEQTIIKKFAHKVYKGNEWFKLDEKDVKKILEFLNKKKCEANDE